MLNPCCQGVGHAVNFDQSQVKSHEGLTCVRMCEFFQLVFLTRSIEYSLVRARFRQVPLFFLQARVFISPCVFFDKVLSLLQAVEYSSVHVRFWQATLCHQDCVQCRRVRGFRVYLGVKTCQVFLSFVAIVRVRFILLTSLFSLCYVTDEFPC